MEMRSSKHITDLQELLCTHPVAAIDDENFSEEDNVKEVSDIESEEETQDIIEQSTVSENFEKKAAHAST